METGRIEKGFYIQGDLKFAVDANDGHKTFDAVAALSHDDKVKLAGLNDIPAEPYNKQLLTTILKSAVQNVWLTNKLGTTPAEVIIAHQNRVAVYKTQLAAPSSSIDLLARKTRKASESKPALSYVIDPAKYEEAYKADKKKFQGQRYLVIKALIELSATGTNGKTVNNIDEKIVEGRETMKPTRNAINGALKVMKEAGFVTCLNPREEKPKAAPAAKKDPAPTKKKH